MSEQKWEVGSVKLVNGTDATIYRYCEKRRRYIGAWHAVTGAAYAAEWTASGSQSIGGIGDPMLDLAPPPKKKLRVQKWLNIYEGAIAHLYPTKEQADAIAGEHRFACIEIDREVEEGEGLDPNVRSDAANMRSKDR